MISKLKNVDRRIIYILVFVAIALPMFKPVGLPFSISTPTQNFYDNVEALPPGSVVCFATDHGPSSMAELHPQAQALTKHLFSKDIKVVFWSIAQGGPLMTDLLEEELSEAYGKVYGVDYVSLGYIAGGEPAMAAFAADIHSAFPQDRYGTPIGDLPMMANIQTANDLAMFLNVSGQTPGPAEYIRRIGDTYDVPFAAGVNAVSVAGFTPYYASGQMFGYLNGLRGAAEYESLIDCPADGIISMDCLSSSTIIVILFILVGNVAYFLDPDRKAKRR